MTAKKAIIGAVLAAVFTLSGCNSAGKNITESAGNKNLNLDGFLSYGKVETANNETATPQGILIVGRVTYKSRKVGIPADQKVPTTGYFKATKTKSLFGTEEMIIEYDFTAGSDKDAKAALEELKKRQEAAQKTFTAGGGSSGGNTAGKDAGAGKDTPTAENPVKTPANSK